MSKVAWAPQYDNGSTALLPLLVDWDGLGHELHPEAAGQLTALDAAFFAVFGKHITISEAFRDLPTQVYFWNLYQLGQGNVAAYPGSSSHGEGVAIDINSWVYLNSTGSAEHQWLRANAPSYGWSWDAVGRPSGEPWHWNYLFGTRTVVAGNIITPITAKPSIGDEDMQLIWDNSGPGGQGGNGYLITGLGRTVVSQEEYNLFFRLITSDQTNTPFDGQMKTFTPVAKHGFPHIFTAGEIAKMDAVLARAAATIVNDLKNAIRREDRYDAFQAPSGLVIAVDWRSGQVLSYASYDDLLADVNDKIVELIIDDKGTNPAVTPVTQAKFDEVLASAKAIFESKSYILRRGAKADAKAAAAVKK